MGSHTLPCSKVTTPILVSVTIPVKCTTQLHFTGIDALTKIGVAIIIVVLPVMGKYFVPLNCGQEELAHILVLIVKTQKLGIFYFWKFDITFDSKSIKLV